MHKKQGEKHASLCGSEEMKDSEAAILLLKMCEIFMILKPSGMLWQNC